MIDISAFDTTTLPEIVRNPPQVWGQPVRISVAAELLQRGTTWIHALIRENKLAAWREKADAHGVYYERHHKTEGNTSTKTIVIFSGHIDALREEREHAEQDDIKAERVLPDHTQEDIDEILRLGRAQMQAQNYVVRSHILREMHKATRFYPLIEDIAEREEWPLQHKNKGGWRKKTTKKRAE